jgi:hypothetical protein
VERGGRLVEGQHDDCVLYKSVREPVTEKE